jgi:hypothetical protein
MADFVQVGFMQEFTVAFGRVSGAAIAANPELKNHVTDLLSRAYFNLHATSLASADPRWVSAITAAGLQLCLDSRMEHFSPRTLVQLFENVIRISEEHLRESRRHAAMASNVFYLKETSLDAMLTDAQASPYHAVSTTVTAGATVAHTGRVRVPEPGEPIV